MMNKFYPDYAIGVKRYSDEQLHYIYDREMIVSASSVTRFIDRLTGHAENGKPDIEVEAEINAFMHFKINGR